MKSTTVVTTANLPKGEVVATTPVDGTDFGISLVSPNRSRHGRHFRTVRSVIRAQGGMVVYFDDGTKSRPLNGHTGWEVADPHLADPRDDVPPGTCCGRLYIDACWNCPIHP